MELDLKPQVYDCMTKHWSLAKCPNCLCHANGKHVVTGQPGVQSGVSWYDVGPWEQASGVFMWSPPSGTGVFSEWTAPASRSHSWYKTLTYLRYQDSQIIMTRHWSRQNINNAVLITWLRCPAGSNWGKQLEIIKHHQIKTKTIIVSILFLDSCKIHTFSV